MKPALQMIVFALLASTAAAQTNENASLLQNLQREASAERIERDIRTLVGFGTRHTLSEIDSQTRGIGAARRWVKAELEAISRDCGGCLEVFYVSDFVEGEPRIPERTEVVSVIALQRGRRDPDRIVMMSGDIDSRVSDPLDSISDSPGANDNASGLAAVIEAARILTKHKFDGTIVYAALSGEEQGLFGGEIVARYALDHDWRIMGVLNNDMIGNIKGVDGIIDNSVARVFSEGTRYVETPEEARLRRYTGGEVDSPSRNLARYIDRLADKFIPNLDVMMIYRLDRFGRGGHHRPFNEVGFPGVRIMETHENYTQQHQDIRTEDGVAYGDTIEHVDFDYARKLTSLNIVALAAMASAPPFPANVEIEGAVQASTTLKWDRPTGKAAKNLAGYRIYWRLTDAPRWTWSRDVGNVGHATLENIVIDNYYFGVAALGKDGSESPVVFPGPAGSFGAWAPEAGDQN